MKRSTGTEPGRLFIDTWGWLALADARESAHAAAVAERRKRLGHGQLVTTDFILDETFTRLFSRGNHGPARQFCDAIFESAKVGLLSIERITPERFEAAYRLRIRYRDKPAISFTDLTSFVVMKELGLTDALTADAHYTQVQLGFHRFP